ncbi:hypothetical protein [Stygiolobus caldivivus]|uniref:Uncharacterized protein n=1 Tax=Stygiolobus caldivivus TaxID=2824673 RepID=A0A8D5U4P8_9CREN|nr:hypothetical protein [Stygiolobus caldivivus]BCU68904.1 hypothetical protein KN1_02010 [Stygiolobus caldivivus]
MKRKSVIKLTMIFLVVVLAIIVLSTPISFLLYYYSIPYSTPFQKGATINYEIFLSYTYKTFKGKIYSLEENGYLTVKSLGGSQFELTFYGGYLNLTCFNFKASKPTSTVVKAGKIPNVTTVLGYSSPLMRTLIIKGYQPTAVFNYTPYPGCSVKEVLVKTSITLFDIEPPFGLMPYIYVDNVSRSPDLSLVYFPVPGDSMIVDGGTINFYYQPPTYNASASDRFANPLIPINMTGWMVECSLFQYLIHNVTSNYAENGKYLATMSISVLLPNSHNRIRFDQDWGEYPLATIDYWRNVIILFLIIIGVLYFLYRRMV